MRSKNKPQKHLPPTLLSFRALPPTPSGAGRWEMGVIVCSLHIVSPTALGEESFPCTSMGSLTQESVLHELLQYESILEVTVLH